MNCNIFILVTVKVVLFWSHTLTKTFPLLVILVEEFNWHCFQLIPQIWLHVLKNSQIMPIEVDFDYFFEKEIVTRTQVSGIFFWNKKLFQKVKEVRKSILLCPIFMTIKLVIIRDYSTGCEFFGISMNCSRPLPINSFSIRVTNQNKNHFL